MWGPEVEGTRKLEKGESQVGLECRGSRGQELGVQGTGLEWGGKVQGPPVSSQEWVSLVGQTSQSGEGDKEGRSLASSGLGDRGPGLSLTAPEGVPGGGAAWQAP